MTFGGDVWSPEARPGFEFCVCKNRVLANTKLRCFAANDVKERDMKTEDKIDERYQAMIQSALIDALFKVAKSEDGSTCILKSGEISEARQ